MELAVIDRMGFNAYFLIVWDFVKWAKDHGIGVGPGRGSAAGSIVAFSLRITDVDPLRYDLLFERFLNPERVSMPDIDIDFSVRGRERVMRYVTEKYGRESVAQIITFGKMFPRAATRDAARVLGHDYGAGDRLAKLIPDPIMGRPPSFDDCLRDGEQLRAAYDSDPTAKEIIDVAKGLEGIVRNSSIHAAAVVIAGMPLTDVVPLQLADAGTTDERGEREYRMVTQFSMKPVEQLGLLKMDFLGLRNLDVIEDALDIIERSDGERPDMTALPLDDPGTYEMLARGRLDRRVPVRVRGHARGAQAGAPDRVRRPRRAQRPLPPRARWTRSRPTRGASATATRSRSPTSAWSPSSGRPTGSCCTRSRPCSSPRSLAGFSGAKADDLRKAIGKKNRAAMAELEPEFRAGCAASGTSPQVIDWLWATNEKSADYSFNKSHAACYALISYRTAWLKANYPAEYMAALISSVMDTKDKVPFFVAQTEDMGIEILPPDVNLSDHEFVVVDGNIRFGLDAVKGVGFAAVEAIKAAREDGGPFGSIWDFCARVDPRAVNKRAIEALIKCGAFGSTGATRRGMLDVLEQAQGAGQKQQLDAQIGQGSIFDMAGDAGAAGAPSFAPSHPPIPAGEFDQPDLLALEKESIGVFISAHPLKEVREAMRQAVDFPLADLADRRDGDWVTAGGIITQAKKIRTKKGDPMMFATLDDLEGAVEILVFGKALAEYEGALGVDSVVLVRGRVDHKDAAKTCLIVQTVEPFAPTPEEVEAAREEAARRPQGPSALTVALDARALPATVIDELKHVLGNHTGEREVVLHLETSSGPRLLRLGGDFKVNETPSLRAELAKILGPEALRVTV